MKYNPYSFSKLSTYEKCPKHFKFKYIDNLEEDEKECLKKGSEIHSILENFTDYKHNNRIVEEFISSDLGKKYLEFINNSKPNRKEFAFGLTKQLEPCSFEDETCLFRGKVDLMFVKDKMLNLIDYKTGKYKDERYQNYEQLIFYAIYFFYTYKYIRWIRISFVYVEHCLENHLILSRDSLPIYIKKMISLISKIEHEEQFNCNMSRLCDYCSFKDLCNAKEVKND